jgi:hypothetical protein
MELSVLERLATNIESTIANLQTQGGYQLTISRATKKINPAHLAGFIYQLPAQMVNDAMIQSNEWRQQFAIVVYVIPLDDDTTAVDTYNNDIAASLHMALMNDYTRGGLALDTIVMPTMYFPPVDGEFSGITFIFDIHYRTTLDKPYQSMYS